MSITGGITLLSLFPFPTQKKSFPFHHNFVFRINHSSDPFNASQNKRQTRQVILLKKPEEQISSSKVQNVFLRIFILIILSRHTTCIFPRITFPVTFTTILTFIFLLDVSAHFIFIDSIIPLFLFFLFSL